MGSSRLPGKVLKVLMGKPMLWHIVDRVRASEGVDYVLVATSIRSENEVIRQFCAAENIACFSGSEDDVLDRYFGAAKSAGATDLLRITSDCPLVDPELIGRLISKYKQGSFDYMSVATGAGALHETRPTFPDGLDAEVFKFRALERAWHEASQASDREHVTPFIWRNSKIFEQSKLFAETRFPQLRFSVDRPEDFELATRVYGALYRPDRHFRLSDVLKFLAANPQVADLNREGIGREGYEKLWNT